MARTTSLTKIESAIFEPTFFKVIQGGMSAGKTFAIMTILIGYAESYADSLITIAGLSYPHLAKGSIRDFIHILKETNRFSLESWNKTTNTYTFPNGSVIEFVSMDRMSARGPRRDVLFVNEANGIDYETFTQLADRTKDFAIIDYNPSSKFWAHEELVEKRPNDTTFMILTYKDNEALSDREIKNIEQHAPKKGEKPSNYWTVYGLGQIGSLEGNVYNGWIETTLDEITANGRLIRYGLDFGFSNDESAMVGIYDMGENRLGIVEILYQKGILGSKYVETLMSQKIDPTTPVICDSARPEIIAELQMGGISAVGADKNAGSVLRGIDHVQQHQIFYVGENLKREYLSYAWRKTRTGQKQDVPQDGNDHLMDALRYAIDDIHKPKVEYAGVR